LASAGVTPARRAAASAAMAILFMVSLLELKQGLFASSVAF
jgi:hypothetical protein